jgi:hypothetical protein
VGEGWRVFWFGWFRAALGPYFYGAEGPFGGYIDGISKWVLQFFKDGIGEENLNDLAE